MWSSVNAQNQRIWGLSGARQNHPTFHLGAVCASKMNALGRTKIDILILERCLVQSAQLDFTACIQSRRKHFSRMLIVGSGIRHAVECAGKTEAAQRALALRNSLHRP